VRRCGTNRRTLGESPGRIRATGTHARPQDYREPFPDAIGDRRSPRSRTREPIQMQSFWLPFAQQMPGIGGSGQASTDALHVPAVTSPVRDIDKPSVRPICIQPAGHTIERLVVIDIKCQGQVPGTGTENQEARHVQPDMARVFRGPGSKSAHPHARHVRTLHKTGEDCTRAAPAIFGTFMQPSNAVAVIRDYSA
jgi:hypothetical protein